MRTHTSLIDHQTIKYDIQPFREGTITLTSLILKVIHKDWSWKGFQLQEFSNSFKSILKTGVFLDREEIVNIVSSLGRMGLPGVHSQEDGLFGESTLDQFDPGQIRHEGRSGA